MFVIFVFFNCFCKCIMYFLIFIFWLNFIDKDNVNKKKLKLYFFECMYILKCFSILVELNVWKVYVIFIFDRCGCRNKG